MNSAATKFLRQLVEFVYFNIPKSRTTAIDEVYRRAIQDSADFVEAHLDTAIIFEDLNRSTMWRHAMEHILPEGMLLEFGVNEGGSLTQFANHLSRKGDKRPVYGFDSFAGLEEDWTGTDKPRGVFDLKGRLPIVPPQARLVPGWIKDTLPVFLEKNIGPIAFIHIDTDTYSPAATALQLCKARLVPGSLILFDELIGYPNWRSHEFKALSEAFSDSQIAYKAFSQVQGLIAIK